MELTVELNNSIWKAISASVPIQDPIGLKSSVSHVFFLVTSTLRLLPVKHVLMAKAMI